MRKLHFTIDARILTRSTLVCWSWRDELVLALVADILLSSVERRHYTRSLAFGIFRPFGDSALCELSNMGARRVDLSRVCASLLEESFR